MLTRQQAKLFQEIDATVAGRDTPSFNTSDITWGVSDNPLYSEESVHNRTPLRTVSDRVARQLSFTPAAIETRAVDSVVIAMFHSIAHADGGAVMREYCGWEWIANVAR